MTQHQQINQYLKQKQNQQQTQIIIPEPIIYQQIYQTQPNILYLHQISLRII